MFSGQHALLKHNGAYLIDRPGELFEHGLAYLQDGDTELPEEQDLVRRLDLEADFFGLEGLCTSQTGLRRYEVMSANTRIRAVRC